MLGKNAKDRGATVDLAPTGSAVPSQSVIGQGLVVTGDLATEGHIRIQGNVAGAVTANGLELTDSGVIEGDVSVPKGGKKGQVFVVAGRVTGRVTAHIVDVKKGGVVLGGISANEVTIHGSVEGGVDVKNRLTVSATAVVSGDVRTDRLVMEEGGRVNGTIHMGRGKSAARESSDATASESEERADDRSRAVA